METRICLYLQALDFWFAQHPLRYGELSELTGSYTAESAQCLASTIIDTQELHRWLGVHLLERGFTNSNVELHLALLLVWTKLPVNFAICVSKLCVSLPCIHLCFALLFSVFTFVPPAVCFDYLIQSLRSGHESILSELIAFMMHIRMH